MTIDELKHECASEGFSLHRCSEHHFQIQDDGRTLVDVWPTTNKFRWHGAADTSRAKNGSAHKAVKEALHCRKVNVLKTANGAADRQREAVNHPPHYNAGSMEVIDAIEGLALGFHAGNVVKYVARFKHKGGVEDLRKAKWYLERLIELERQGKE